MKKEEFVKMINEEMKALEEGTKKAVILYIETEEQEDALKEIIFSTTNYDENRVCEYDDAPFEIKMYWDENKINTVWLYKYSCIGLLIRSLYGLPYPEYCTLKGLLLGEPIEKFEQQYLADDDEDAEEEFYFYSDNYYKPIHPWHCNVNKVKFYLQGGKEQKPYEDAVYWESERDTSND